MIVGWQLALEGRLGKSLHIPGHSILPGTFRIYNSSYSPSFWLTVPQSLSLDVFYFFPTQYQDMVWALFPIFTSFMSFVLIKSHTLLTTSLYLQQRPHFNIYPTDSKPPRGQPSYIPNSICPEWNPWYFLLNKSPNPGAACLISMNGTTIHLVAQAKN